jgi:predicted component of type VI protein secretion system
MRNKRRQAPARRPINSNPELDLDWRLVRMILTLEVTGAQAQDMGACYRKVFKAIGGTIGRLPDNDWVFTDPYVSGRHALIRYVSGKFFVEDTSTNGVFINSMDNRLARGQPQELRHGDLLYIDAYKINVSIHSDATVALVASRPQSALNRTMLHIEDEDEDEDDDRDTEWFGGGDISGLKPNATAALLPQRSQAQVAKPVVAKAVAPKSSNEAQLQALFDAAGIEGLDPSTEAAEKLGGMLRVALSGIMESLRMRERMKDDLRMKGTSFKAADNNPLKFSANVADAFHNLLVKRNPAYLPPVDAFEEAFHDVRDHQVALPAAMRLAFESMLSQFDPLRLQEEFDRQMKGSLLGVPVKLRYWDLYRDKYGDLIKDAEAGFRTLFGDAFAHAYEEHLERLKQPGRCAGQ